MRQPVNKMSVQITRGDRVVTVPLETVIQDPHQNIPLRPGDVITALHQSLSMSVLGATGKNEEMSFEAQGITLAQALGRFGGVQDNRADAAGVFIFRFEDPAVFGPHQQPLPVNEDGRVPVVYRVDLKNPSTYFVAQSFPMRNRDVVYVANASSAELQKFLNVLVSLVYPFDVISGSLPREGHRGPTHCYERGGLSRHLPSGRAAAKGSLAYRHRSRRHGLHRAFRRPGEGRYPSWGAAIAAFEQCVKADLQTSLE